MTRTAAPALLAVLAALAGTTTGCLRAPAAIADCTPQGAETPYCGYRNPEDLVALPGGRSLLVSEYGGMEGERDGAVVRLDLRTGARTALFEVGGPALAEAGWGAPDCPGPPVSIFAPHGIDLVRRDDGRLALLLVAHGAREAVEFFEVTDPAGDARVAWRGCAVAPADAWLNDVVALADGGFLVSSMMPRRSGVLRVFELAKAALLGVASGRVLAWSPDAGFAPVPGTEAALANGLALSADGERLYVNASLSSEVIGVERRTGRVLGRAHVATPDNSTWAADGRLWVASLAGRPLDIQACNGIRGGACPVPFEIVAVDPQSFETERIYRSEGARMGGGTVGLQVGDALYVGSFAGDRVLRVALGGGGS